MLINGGSTWLTPMLHKTPHEITDFAPISLMVREVTLLVVHPSVPVNTVKELIAFASARPGTLNYASTVIGGSSHLAMELFKSMAGINIVHVPYKGSGPALAGILANEVQVAIDGVQLLPNIKSGKLRALGVSTSQPSPLAPGMPTIASTGLPGFEWLGVAGIWTRAGTPDAIVRRLNQEIVRVLNQPDVKDRFFKAGAEVVANAPEQFAAYIKNDIVRMGKVIKDAGIRVD
jgi:tripartite-type tricarboxylate transporter receptor subunit TctC